MTRRHAAFAAALATLWATTVACGERAAPTSATATAGTAAQVGVSWFGEHVPNRKMAVKFRQFVLPLNNPAVVPARDAAHMRADDIVIGVVHEGVARAYPWFVVTRYHAVNDVLGGAPLFIAHCEKCSGAGAFIAEARKRVLTFTPCGTRAGTWIACDYETASRWHPFMGTAWAGPLDGERLRRVPASYQRWDRWQAEHPDSTVVVAGAEMRQRFHGRHDTLGDASVLGRKKLAPDAERPRRAWLPLNTMVFGMTDAAGASPLATPVPHLAAQGGLIQGDHAGTPYVLLVRDGVQVAGYARRAPDGTTLTFTQESAAPYRLADQRGTLWNAWGRAVSGPDAGAQLPLLHGYLTEWYEWVEAHAETEVAGR